MPICPIDNFSLVDFSCFAILESFSKQVIRTILVRVPIDKLVMYGLLMDELNKKHLFSFKILMYYMYVRMYACFVLWHIIWCRLGSFSRVTTNEKNGHLCPFFEIRPQNNMNSTIEYKKFNISCKTCCISIAWTRRRILHCCLPAWMTMPRYGPRTAALLLLLLLLLSCCWCCCRPTQIHSLQTACACRWIGSRRHRLHLSKKILWAVKEIIVSSIIINGIVIFVPCMYAVLL